MTQDAPQKNGESGLAMWKNHSFPKKNYILSENPGCRIL